MQNRSVIYAFKRLHSGIKIGLAVSLLILINYECYILTLPPKFIFLLGLNKVIIQILYAFLTGFIFYFIIDHLQQEKKRVYILRLLNNCVHHIYEINKDLVHAICESSGEIKETSKVTFEDFCRLCVKVDIRNEIFTIWYIGNYSALQSVFKGCELLKRHVDEIMLFYELLDEEWSSSLANILDNIKRIELHLSSNAFQPTLNLISSPLWNNYVESRKLIKLRNEFDKKYYKQNKEINPPGGYIPKDVTITIEVPIQNK